MTTDTRRVLARLEESGLLLLSDSRLPSIAGIVAGEPVSGSWWGHAKGKAIFNAAEIVMERDDVLTCKLVNGKITLVTRRLWGALVTVAESGEAWQRTSVEAEWLLEGIRRSGEASIEAIPRPSGVDRKSLTKLVDSLEKTLVFHVRSEHTDSGRHVRVLATWERFCASRVFPRPRLAVDRAKSDLEAATRQLAGDAAGPLALPWGKVRR